MTEAKIAIFPLHIAASPFQARFYLLTHVIWFQGDYA